MKSKSIQKINLTDNKSIVQSFSTKPLHFIYTILLMGSFLILSNGTYAMLGLMMILFSLFCLIVLPNPKVVAYTNEYLIIYNSPNKDMCTLIFYDEVVSWYYQSNKDFDEVIFEMADGHREVLKTYARKTVVPYLYQYLSGKEKIMRKM